MNHLYLTVSKFMGKLIGLRLYQGLMKEINLKISYVANIKSQVETGFQAAFHTKVGKEWGIFFSKSREYQHKIKAPQALRNTPPLLGAPKVIL